MKRNMTEIEERLIVILWKNSRKSILDISKELGVSRITAKKALDSLIGEGRIKNFTITLDEDDKDFAMVHVKDMENLPMDLITEYFRLIDNTYIAIMYYENLIKIKGPSIIDVKIATSRNINETVGRFKNLHCDYCLKEIIGVPINVKIQGKTSYACCPNCEHDLKKRRDALSDLTV